VVDKKSKKIKKTYTKNDGLIQNTIYGMLRDRQGFFWLSHPKGITKWDKKKGHFEHHFVQIDLPTVGMKEQGTFSGTAYLSPFTGKIYFGTDEGLIVFQPEKLKQNDKKPNVFISKCRVLGKEYALDSAINVKKEIVLPYDENFINFELAALNYSNFQLNQYAYCMENFEKNWVELGTKNEAIYTNLPPGEYIFRFRASNDKGIWNEEGNFIRVVILPPWWATWWFRFSAFVFILASIRTVYKLRVNRLENRSFLLEKTVQERTLEIAEQKAKISAALAHNKAITDALDSSAVVSITDLRGRIVKANQIFERVSGYTHEEIIGQDHRLVNSGYHPKSFWIEMWKTIALGKTWRAEVCNRAKNGEIYWVDTVINPVFDENGKIYQYLSIRTLITQRKNAEKIIQEQNAELQENLTQLTILRQNSEESRIKVEHLLQNFTKSVNYALRIQEAIIPKEKELQKYWDCFVYFRPKDIVSGDFYWFADKGHTKILAVADCTGHGVSGAFMTMIGNNILNQIVHDYEMHEPNEILNLMPLLLEKTLLHSEGKIKDGMDISVIAVETEKDEKGNEIIARISYAGAMNPLFLVKNHQFMEIKADKKPISGVIDDNFAYKKHEILINENHFAAVPEMNKKGIFSATPEYSETEQCVLYLCSDGFQDQFGGADDKKFMVKNFKKLLFDISEKPICEQKEILEQTFETWKGNQEQTDDVMVLGIKIV
jgi:PAS domain S-box-containing protein